MFKRKSQFARCLFLVAALSAALVFSPAARAQDRLPQFENQIYMLNQTPLTQSSRLKSSDYIFSMKVIDANRQWVGDVEDVKIDESGSIATLVSEINRVGREEFIVQSGADDLVFREDISSFQIPLAASPEERRDTSPEALAAISPAAGGGKLFSLKAMQGADVLTDQGRSVGTVSDVIFDEQGQYIQALMLQNVPGARRYTEIALPYDPRLVSLRSDYGRVEFRVNADAAQALSDFARETR